MKNSFYIILFSLVLFSCGSSRQSSSQTAEDKLLITAIKKVEKNPSDSNSLNGLKELYNDAATSHLNNIDTYKTLLDESKWNKILKEYNALEGLYKTVNASKVASEYIKPLSFATEIQNLKLDAADYYFKTGTEYLDLNDKASARKAYSYFTKANNFNPGLSDIKSLLKISKEKSILNVVVNPIRDNSMYYRDPGSNRFGNSFNNDYLQRNLVRDLGGSSSSNSLARFYTDIEANRSRVDVDWVVDLTWTDLDVPRPRTRQYNQNVSKQIVVGKDTTGKAVYETVIGVLYITEEYFTARGELETRITDAHTGYNIDLNRYNSTIDWKQQYATYRGDPRALSNQDKSILNHQTVTAPRKEDILNELFQKIYPQARNGIQRLTR